MTDGPSRDSGHRLVGHVADIIVEAWAASRVACFEEAARGLIESFADVEGVSPTRQVPVTFGVDGDDEMLVALLEEVIYVVEVLGQIPVQVNLDEHEDGSLWGAFETIAADRVEVTGALPKGVSRSGLVCEQRDRLWRCRALVDV